MPKKTQLENAVRRLRAAMQNPYEGYIYGEVKKVTRQNQESCFRKDWINGIRCTDLDMILSKVCEHNEKGRIR